MTTAFVELHTGYKMYVKEFFQGLHPENKPSVTLFENTYNYKEILIERNISFHSDSGTSFSAKSPEKPT